MKTKLYETLIENERELMTKEALKIAIEQAKLNIISMESLLENSLNKTKYYHVWAALVANEVNADTIYFREENRKRKSEKLEISQFQSNQQNDSQVSKFEYQLYNQSNNSNTYNTNTNKFNLNFRNRSRNEPKIPLKRKF